MEVNNLSDIDTIMNMLDWNNSSDEQNRGIKLAENIESINVFLQPRDKKHNKNVWDNCAIILSKRSDEELKPYLIPLLEWLQDLTWPGALCVLDRINTYHDYSSLKYAYEECIKRAKVLNENIWLKNLNEISGVDLLK